MNKDIIEGNWKEIKGQVKQKWGKFNDDDVTRMEGNYEELSGHLQKKYGYKKDEAEKEINTFVKENNYK
jgi:uncharacterized protein YjbJ (UPF0337 family)